MKIFRLFSIAAAALMMAACSSEDTAQNNNPVAGRQMHFTATIAAPNSGAGTRTEYTEDTENKKITVAWKVGDEIALVHDKVMDVVKVKTVNADGSATIDGTITSATDEATVQLVYPAARVSAVNSDGNPEFNETVSGKLLTQDGTLTYIQNNIDFREGEGQLSVNGTELTLNAAVDMVSSIAIWKLTLQDNAETPAALSATQVSVKLDGETPVTIASTAKLSTATSSVYLAMPEMAEPETTVTIEAVTANGNYTYVNSGLALAAGKYYQSKVTMAPAVTDLSKLTADYVAQNGDVLTGTLKENVKISIADGATVTLDGVTINGENNVRCKWAGITCEGDATIILKDGSTNTVKGFHQNYPGIHVPSGTLTIKGETEGTGKLIASSNGWGAGIGGGYGIACGNIIIEGGTITATGGSNAAGIGSGSGDTCSDITISGGTVTATGGSNAAGIGSGNNAGCGDIKITSGVTKVTATKGAGAPNSIGKGNGRGASCGTVTIGGTVYWDGGNYRNDGDSYLINDIVYPSPFANVTISDLGKVIGADGKIYADATAASAASTTAVAMIAYVGNDAETSPTNTAFKNGLALALEDVSDKKTWCSQTSATCLGTQYDSDRKFNDLAGIANTDALVGHAHTHAAASAARNYNSGTHPAGTSAWFLPSAGQWNKMIGSTGLGLSNLGLLANASYWSSTEDGASSAWGFNSYNGFWANSGSGKDAGTIRVRACLAF